MRWMILLCCLLAVNGCSKKTSSPASSSPVSGSRGTSTAALPAPQFQGNPSDVLVEVDGTKLTRGEIDAQTEYQLAGAMDQIPVDQVDAARQQIRSRVVQQFIYRVLLRNEAERQKITVSKEDEELAFKEIAAQLPPGVTVEMAMKNSPLGEKAMREEVLTGIKVKRLLDRFMTNTVEVTEQEITDYLAMYKNNLIMPEIVRARHILIATSPSDDEKAKTEKKKKAEEAQQKLAKGGDFAKLAEEYSDCPSKKRGGDLGPFTREKMVKPFSDAAFSQEVNAIGPIVETQFGYHIIQVTEHNQAGPAPREKVVDILRGQKRQKAMQDYLEELKSKANIKDETDVKSSATIRRSAVSAPFPANNQATKTP